MQITITIQDQNATKIVEKILRAVEKESSFNITRNESSCEVPNSTETDPAKKIAEEQKYILCRFASIQRQLFDLQNDLTNKNDLVSAGMTRDAMRHLKLAEEDYLFVSRRRLSYQLMKKDQDHAVGWAARKPHGSCD